ncbi:MAG: mechanosensitive ion channel family protein [Cellvibrionaceae bacterium]
MLNSYLSQVGVQTDQGWIIEVFVIVFAAAIASFFARGLLRKLIRQAEKSHNLWDDALMEAAFKPVTWFIWLVGVAWAADITSTHSESALFDLIPVLRKVGMIGLLIWFMIGFIRQVEKNFLDPDFTREKYDETTVLAIGKLLRISIIITGALVVLQSLGYSVSGVLAFGGIGGIAVGFAAKDLLANFFGGLMIYLDRPFKVGDWIRSPDKNIEGTVEDIGWRLTRIRTFDKRPLYIPNSTFTQISVENPSRMTNRRIYETIGIRYDDVSKMDVVVSDVKVMLQNHPEIDTSQTMIVNFNAFSASSVDFFVYTFTKTTDWVRFHEIKQDVLLKISEIISGHDAEMAFPTSTVHLQGKLESPELQGS